VSGLVAHIAESGPRTPARRRARIAWLAACATLLPSLAACYGQDPRAEPPPRCDEVTATALFARRIEPLIAGGQPQSCNQCHLSGVDLGMFVRDSACASMACLVDRGEVDLERPAESKILARIALATPASALITQEVIDAETAGFLDWITYSAACQATACPPMDDPCGRASAPSPTLDALSPLGDCSEPALVQAFDTRVYAWADRCGHCHSACTADFPAPCWLEETADGANDAERLGAAARSMYNLIGLGALDTASPMDSTLLLKPLSTSVGGLEHGGGGKFEDLQDQTYQDFALFAETYAACYAGQALQRPVAAIVEPRHQTRFDVGAPIPLVGDAVDPQEGPLLGSALSWWLDDADAPFATGRTPADFAPPAGNHVVTLRATDADGNTGDHRITVRVTAP
jgi:hypothetical protein